MDRAVFQCLLRDVEEALTKSAGTKVPSEHPPLHPTLLSMMLQDFASQQGILFSCHCRHSLSFCHCREKSVSERRSSVSDTVSENYFHSGSCSSGTCFVYSFQRNKSLLKES